jgi:hypothetical protein
VTDGANPCNRGLYNDIPESSAQCDGAPCPPVPLVSLEQLLSTHNELIQKLVENDDGRALRQQDHQLPHDSSYSDFLATHPLMFAKVIDPLEADNSFLNTKSKFVPLRCNEYQKTIYTVQFAAMSIRRQYTQSNNSVGLCECLVGELHHHTLGQPLGVVNRVP